MRWLADLETSFVQTLAAHHRLIRIIDWGFTRILYFTETLLLCFLHLSLSLPSLPLSSCVCRERARASEAVC